MVLRVVDADSLRFLELHETRAHALPGRRIRDLGDAVLLHDPVDPEPFWNRICLPSWPEDARAFDRRLDEVITLFATLDRYPHVWPRPAFNRPADIVERLVAAGFEDTGSGLLLVLDDLDRVSGPGPAGTPGVEVVRLSRRRSGHVARTREFSTVLCEAFEVDDGRCRSIEVEALAQVGLDAFQLYLVLVDGEPAAVAKRVTFDGATYLSSIGTRPSFRGRGLGALATIVAARDGLEAGCRWVYLGVYSENEVACRMYERLGFVAVGEPVPDLLLRR